MSCERMQIIRHGKASKSCLDLELPYLLRCAECQAATPVRYLTAEDFAKFLEAL